MKWTQEDIDAEVTTYSDDWEYKLMPPVVEQSGTAAADTSVRTGAGGAQFKEAERIVRRVRDVASGTPMPDEAYLYSHAGAVETVAVVLDDARERCAAIADRHAQQLRRVADGIEDQKSLMRELAVVRAETAEMIATAIRMGDSEDTLHNQR